MNFKIDDNLPAEIRDDLRAVAHDPEPVSDEGLTGSPDEVLLGYFRREKRKFLALDTGIAEARSYPPDHCHGFIVFRPTSDTGGRGGGLTGISR